MNWWQLKKYRRRFLLGAVYGFGFYLASSPGTELSTWATRHFIPAKIVDVSNSTTIVHKADRGAGTSDVAENRLTGTEYGYDPGFYGGGYDPGSYGGGYDPGFYDSPLRFGPSLPETFKDRWPNNTEPELQQRSDRNTKIATKGFTYSDTGHSGPDTRGRTYADTGYNAGFDSGSYNIRPTKKTAPKKRSGASAGYLSLGSATDGNIIDGQNGSGTVTEGYTTSGTVTDGYTGNGKRKNDLGYVDTYGPNLGYADQYGNKHRSKDSLGYGFTGRSTLAKVDGGYIDIAGPNGGYIDFRGDKT